MTTISSKAQSHRILILGGGYAGRMAAVRLGRRLPKNAELTLVDSESTFVERIRLHQMAAGQTVQKHPFERLLPRGVGFHRGRVSGIDVARRTVSLVDPEDDVATLVYDQLIYALGSRSATAVPGVQEFATPLNAAALNLEPGQTLLVVGAGLTGVELAAEVAESHPTVAVTLATGQAGIGKGLTPEARSYVEQVLADLGVKVAPGPPVDRLEKGLAFRDGVSLPFDHCVWTAGFEVSPLARDAGLPVDERGRVLVDDFLAVPNHPEITVIGDAARVCDALENPLRASCATAMPMGAYAGEAVACRLRGQTPAPFRFGYLMLNVSLGRKRGVVQLLDRCDRPKKRFLRGRLAAFIKERICRMTLWSPRLESRLGIPTLSWPQTALTPASAPLALTEASMSERLTTHE